MPKPNSLPLPLISLNDPMVDTSLVGGKGANLVRLVQGNFPVPAGFLIPTTAYLDFVSKNDLQAMIEAALEGINPAVPEDLEKAAALIRGEFAQGKMPVQLREAISAGWQSLGGGAVAVRSSATAEDLPEMSFAGQQDTFLNVRGTQSLLEAVVQCWSSLWTARAIGYRTRNQIPHTEVSLSVIVQQMVNSQASGVLFTANPLTGLRSEVVIDATLGLGEALVSGQVEPDHYVVNPQEGARVEKFIGSKLVSIHGLPEGGVQTTSSQAATSQAIPDQVILQLAAIGKKIEREYQFPQDIEWAWAEDKIYILQSRPITSLYPLPPQKNSGFLRVYFSFGAVQGLLDPMTPLGQDSIRLIFSGAASLFGVHGQNQHTQPVLQIAGERLWGDMSGVVRHPIGSKIILKIFPGIEPGSLNALHEILADPKIAAGSGTIKLQTIGRLAKFAARMLKRMIRVSLKPEEKALLIQQAYQEDIEQLRRRYEDPETSGLSLETNIALIREIRNAFVYAIPEILPGILPGLLPLFLLSKYANQWHGSNDLAMEITRGLPHNVTTEMDLVLWETAKAIKADEPAYEAVKNSSAENLAMLYLNNKLPPEAQKAIAAFLNKYGMRGLGEIDIGRPRWRENPTQILKTIQSYLQIEDENNAPDAVFKRGEIQAQKALETLQASALKTLGGKFKAKLIHEAARRVRALGGLRESPKFYIIQLMGVIRKSLLTLGQELVLQGKLEQADDLFYLYLDDLEAFSRQETRDWPGLIRQRRENYQREMLRKQIPRLMVSDGRTYYEGMTASDLGDGNYKGSPVSPGIVEGVVKVIRDPHQAHLLPGEILVCPGTDPAWTPLFLAASGLVMEVGGLMTHGAIVAREYGIPAVVGVNHATQILQTGDRIRINGSTGLIEKIS